MWAFEIVLSGRSAGMRLTFGSGIIASDPDQTMATTRGGPAIRAPAVAVFESNPTGSDGCGSVIQQCPRFVQCTTERY